MKTVDFSVGLAVGAMVGWLLATRPLAITQVPILEVMTALGTVGAVWAALWQARRAHQREDEREESTRIAAADDAYLRARLSAAQIGLKLTPIIDIAVDIGQELQELNDAPSYLPIQREQIEHLLSRYSRLELSFPLDALLALAPLPNECADNVAAGLASLEVTRSQMAHWLEPILVGEVGVKGRQNLLEQWYGEIYDATAALEAAQVELKGSYRSLLRYVID